MERESYRNGVRPLIPIPQCETCENFIRGDFTHCKCLEWELKLSGIENKSAPGEKKSIRKGDVAAPYLQTSYIWVWCCVIVIIWLSRGCMAYWFYSQPRFHDLTVELGTETISVEAFMTEFANARNAGIVTDLSTVDISVVGNSPLTLRSGHKDETGYADRRGHDTAGSGIYSLAAEDT